MSEILSLPVLQGVDSHFPSDPKPTSLPVANSTRSFWLHSSLDCNPLAKSGDDTPLPPPGTDYDIVIIGTGISGVFTLYHLLQGLKTSNRSITRIALFEARDFCSGATGRNGGHCTASNACSFKYLVEKEGLKDARAHVALELRAVKLVSDLINRNGWEEEVDLTSHGCIHLVGSDEERHVLEENLEAARKGGVDLTGFEWLDRATCSKLIGSRSNLSGVRIPGNNLYPLKLVTKTYGLCQEIARNIGIDLTLFTNTPVTEIKSLAPSNDAPSFVDNIWHLSTPRGHVKAKRVVHATNAYASHLLPQLVRSGSRRMIVPTRGQVIAARPEGDKKFWNTGFSYNEGFEYFFQRPKEIPAHSSEPVAADPTDRSGVPYVILGGGRSIAPPPYELDIVDDSTREPTVTAYLENFLPTHFPSLFPLPSHKTSLLGGYHDLTQTGRPAGDPCTDGHSQQFDAGNVGLSSRGNLKIDFSWSGIMGFTKSRNPFIGQVYDDRNQPVKGQFMLAGYSGHGMSRAPACAEAVARMVLADIEGKPAPSFDWVPSHFYTSA